MPEQLNERVTRVEMRVEEHERKLSQLHVDMRTMNDTLQGILRIIGQLRWLIVGFLAAVVGNEFGFIEMLKKYLGV